MSLADELLADLEEGGEDDIMEDNDGDAAEAEATDVIDDITQEMEMEISATSIRSIAKLRDSKQLTRIIADIEKYQDAGKKVCGPVEASPEYQCIVEANNITIEIDNEINIIHKFARDHYAKRFPELESLVSTPLEYIRLVKELGNDISKSKNNEVLTETLTPATVMVVSVTASTTQGTRLTEEELAIVNEACNMGLELNEMKLKIFRYVESRMSFIAPNLSIIVGATTAAKLMGVAGGLTSLSKMPACNVILLGSQKRSMGGFHSAQQIQPHMGFIYFSEIVQKTPPDLRKKAVRLVSAKCTLAARVDSFHESSDGGVGDGLLAEIEHKLEKLQEPPPLKAIKPLPTPLDEAKKKRGGRRARKMKERLGMSEMRKQNNRMNFGEIEEDAYQDDLGFTKGNLGKKGGTGKIRGPVVDSKTKARISKTLQQKVSKQNQSLWGGSTSVKRQVSGTSSSVAFTPLQGLEIVNPQAAEKMVQEANQKYFSATSSFINVKKKP